MTTEIERHLARIEKHLHRIADALDADRPAPNYHRPLAAYTGFNWTNIGASILESDDNGASRVIWRQHIYTRRSNAKYGPGVWFSRGAGRDEDGNVQYARLITFSLKGAVEELPGKVLQALNTATPPTAPAPTPATKPQEETEAPSELDRFFPREGETPQEETQETPRHRFFRLLPIAIAAGLAPGDANTLTALAQRTNYTAPLATLEKHLERLEATEK